MLIQADRSRNSATNDLIKFAILAIDQTLMDHLFDISWHSMILRN
jgi:hypothetical protein